MRRTVVLIAASALALALAACGKADDEAPGGMDAVPPADAPAAPEAATEPATVDDYGALGTEPFWRVDLVDETLKLTRPDHPELTAKVASTVIEDGEITWTTEAGAGPVVLSITEEECSDGMSDAKYAYSAELTVAGGETLKGCAFPAGQQPREGR